MRPDGDGVVDIVRNIMNMNMKIIFIFFLTYKNADLYCPRLPDNNDPGVY
jgi:hypothetical protein